MRHGAGPGTSGGTDELTAQIEKLSTEDAFGNERLGCCFCNDAVSLFNVHQIKTHIFWTCSLVVYVLYHFYWFYYWSVMFNVVFFLQPIPNGTLPGLTSVASGKAVELFARMLHHPDE